MRKVRLGRGRSKAEREPWAASGLRMVSIKAKRDVRALLTPEQRAKEKTEHDKVLEQHKDAARARGTLTAARSPNRTWVAMPQSRHLHQAHTRNRGIPLVDSTKRA